MSFLLRKKNGEVKFDNLENMENTETSEQFSGPFNIENALFIKENMLRLGETSEKRKPKTFIAEPKIRQDKENLDFSNIYKEPVDVITDLSNQVNELRVGAEDKLSKDKTYCNEEPSPHSKIESKSEGFNFDGSKFEDKHTLPELTHSSSFSMKSSRSHDTDAEGGEHLNTTNKNASIDDWEDELLAEEIDKMFSKVRHNRTDFVVQALKDGFDPNSRDQNGNTMLHVCAQNNNRQLANYLLQQYPGVVDVNAENLKSFTPLDYCEKYGFFKMANWLSAQGGSSGAMPLQFNSRLR